MAGRPRDPELESRLLQAGWLALTSEGYASLTLSGVAAQGGAHRTDVYRRWSSKPQFVVDVLAGHLPPVADIDTGSLLGDISAALAALALTWSSEWIDGLIGLVADLRVNLDAEHAFRSLAEMRGDLLKGGLERAVARGELPPSTDAALAGDLLEGPLMHRRLILRRPLDAPYLEALAGSVHALLTGGAVTR